MVARVVLFVEGGGEKGQRAKDLPIRMRRAFNKFLVRAGIPEGRFRINRCGSRDRALQDFTNAIGHSGAEDFPLLLVDSEGPVAPGTGPWTHLFQRDGWRQPPGATDEHAQLMTQCMESWFLADVGAVAGYYGTGFHAGSLPATQPIEAAAKPAVLSGLNRAAGNTSKKGYDKGGHGFAILERLDPAQVARQAPWACRLLVLLDHKLSLHNVRGCTTAWVP